ncbi:MAG: excinuclease ABC subunit UvrC [Planctomycetes bacterium]|nr:excinuclease ABC subunit UvrC [Planctomycetota bacterium]
MSLFDWNTTDLGEVPERPGVYVFRDRAGQVLYVGKARVLRQRLATYRAGGDGRINLRFLERDAATVETVVTRTEQEALLLEDELIKRHQPLHNVRLKDDKSFLMIRVDLDERFPRLKFVRAHRPKEGKSPGRSRLFGPYASARAVRRAIADLHHVVPLRDCADQVMNHRSRPCLKHQLGLCAAPCVGLIDEPNYAANVARALRILAGDIEELEHDLDARMQLASARQEFELAGIFRDRLAALRRTVERQGVLSAAGTERDVLALARSGDRVLVHRLCIRRGKLAESRAYAFRSELPDAECLHGVLTTLYAGDQERPREIVLPVLPVEDALLSALLGGVELCVPRGGERARQLALACENAVLELARAEAARENADEAEDALARLCGLERGEAPLVIDCFDISNFQGAHVVASRVRFRGGHPDRSGYRRFRVRGVQNQNDFQSMHEVVGRSLRRGVDEGELPDLVVIDGGAQQLASALSAREDAGAWEVRIVSLAKARSERRVRGVTKAASEERLYLTPDSAALVLERHTALRHLLQRIRDEAHRFAITYHRKERGKLRSRLDSIAGLGPVKRKALLARFGSVQGIQAVSVEQLATVPGISAALARAILDELQRAPG